MYNDMLDEDKLEEFLNRIADKYTTEEIVEILQLSEWDILEMFRERVIEKEEKFEV